MCIGIYDAKSVARELAPATAWQPTQIYLTPRNQTVGAGLPAMAAWQSTQLDRVHIHCCGNGHLGFRSDSGSLLEKSPKSNQKGSCPTTRHLA